MWVWEGTAIQYPVKTKSLEGLGRILSPDCPGCLPWAKRRRGGVWRCSEAKVLGHAKWPAGRLAQKRWVKDNMVLTRSPKLLALLLISQAHAVVAVGLAALTGGAVHLVEVGGAVGRLASAELGEVALPHLLTTRGPRSHQLRWRTRRAKQSYLPCPSTLSAKSSLASHPRITIFQNLDITAPLSTWLH